MADDSAPAWLCSPRAQAAQVATRGQRAELQVSLCCLLPPDCAEATTVKLKSNGEIFEVEKEVACRSVTIKDVVEDTGLDTPIALPEVDYEILSKVGPIRLWPPRLLPSLALLMSSLNPSCLGLLRLPRSEPHACTRALSTVS